MAKNAISPIVWQEDMLSTENSMKDEYIKAFKRADGGDF